MVAHVRAHKCRLESHTYLLHTHTCKCEGINAWAHAQHVIKKKFLVKLNRVTWYFSYNAEFNASLFST